MMNDVYECIKKTESFFDEAILSVSGTNDLLGSTSLWISGICHPLNLTAPHPTLLRWKGGSPLYDKPLGPR